MLAALVLVGLVLAAGLSGRLGNGGGAGPGRDVAALAGWSNGPMEGPTLVVLTRSHGITGGDLAGFVGLGLAAFQGVRARQGRPERSRR